MAGGSLRLILPATPSLWVNINGRIVWGRICHRVLIETHTWAELEDKYHLEDQNQQRAEQLTDHIIRKVTESDVHDVIFVTNEDVFSKQSTAKVKKAIQKALGEKFHSVHGLPKSIPEKIRSVLQRHAKQHVS